MLLQADTRQLQPKNGKYRKRFIQRMNKAARKITRLISCSIAVVNLPNITISICEPRIEKGPAIIREIIENVFGTKFYWIS